MQIQKTVKNNICIHWFQECKGTSFMPKVIFKINWLLKQIKYTNTAGWLNSLNLSNRWLMYQMESWKSTCWNVENQLVGWTDIKSAMVDVTHGIYKIRWWIKQMQSLKSVGL